MEIEYQDGILALIARNLAGLATSEEAAQLKEWIGSSVNNKQYFEQIRNIWDTSDKQIDPKTINTPMALKKLRSRIQELSPKRTFWYYWQKIAAVLILPLAIGSFLWINSNSYKKISSNDLIYNEVYTAFGTRFSLTLADSTLVWLNSGSSLKYPNEFNNTNRKVFLKGEAYFEVKSDVSRPFFVETSTLEVKATGTKFNVQEYNSNPITEVTLVSGNVLVNESGNEKKPHVISNLNPSQHLDYDKRTKVKSITNEDPYKYIGWKDGKIIFRNEPLYNVLIKLGMIFNVDIELQGKELQNYRYHASFQDESLEEILKLLKISAPVNFMEVKRNPLPDGSFPKKKIIVFPANAQANITL